jgi:serine/threonine protein kinase
MAPELYDEDPMCTRATDIWAFGCILIYMFSKEVPWSGKEIYAVQRNLVFKNELPIPDSITDSRMRRLIQN